MWSGVVPQQPPAARSPVLTSPAMAAAKSSGPTRKWVQPSTHSGRPALGWRKVGREVRAQSSGKRSAICSGPRPQLSPMASTPRPSSRATAADRSPPVSIRPVSSKVTETKTGRSQFSFAESTAALAS